MPDLESEESQTSIDFVRANKEVFRYMNQPLSPQIKFAGKIMKTESVKDLIKKYGIDGTIKKKKATKGRINHFQTEKRSCKKHEEYHCGCLDKP